MTSVRPGERLRALLEEGFVQLPACHSALTAMIAEQVGFEAVYLSGGATAMERGFPDIGMLTMSEMVDALKFVTAATSLPVVADADTGYGNPLNARRTVREYERAGAAALHLEDQEFPKKCGYLEGKRVVSMEEHAYRVQAACEGRTDSATVVIARTDALQIHGWDEAERRAHAYRDAGADLIFVDGVRSLDVDEYVARLVSRGIPCLFNGGDLSADEAAGLGFKASIQPAAFYASYRAQYESLAVLRKTGRTTRVTGDFSVPPVTDVIGLPETEALELRYGGVREETFQDLEWANRAALLQQFVAREGHSDVPQDHREGGIALGSWVAEVRGLGNEIGGRQAILTPSRRAFLEGLAGWKWTATTR